MDCQPLDIRCSVDKLVGRKAFQLACGVSVVLTCLSIQAVTDGSPFMTLPMSEWLPVDLKLNCLYLSQCHILVCCIRVCVYVCVWVLFSLADLELHCPSMTWGCLLHDNSWYFMFLGGRQGARAKVNISDELFIWIILHHEFGLTHKLYFHPVFTLFQTLPLKIISDEIKTTLKCCNNNQL